MKAEIAVRSINASISACAARMAPRTISSVTGSQARGFSLSFAAESFAADRSVSVEGSIRAVLHDEQGNGTDDGGENQEEGRRDRVLRCADQVLRDERRKAAEQRHRHAVADGEGGEAHLGREQLCQDGAE